jgi:hypothetical protein
MKRITVLLVAAVLSACAGGRDFSVENAAKISPGMTQDDVKAVMGEPLSVTNYGNKTIWTWARVSGFGGSKSATVTFVNGKVEDSPLTQRTN